MFIDPPLLKTEMTWRERNHLFHEESVKLAYKRTSSNPVFFLTSEDFSNCAEFDTEVSAHFTTLFIPLPLLYKLVSRIIC